MSQAREESSRVYKEFGKFYEKFPNLRCQANHQIFLNAAEQDGGSENLSAEWMELQLDSLRGQLAVLSETPDEALNKSMADNPAYDCEANRQIIAQRVSETHESIKQAVSALGNKLAFNQEIADELAAQQQADERASLIEEIALDYSPNKFDQENHRKKLQTCNVEQLRAKAQEVRDRRSARQMSKTELREVIRRASHIPAPELPRNTHRNASVRFRLNTLRILTTDTAWAQSMRVSPNKHKECCA